VCDGVIGTGTGKPDAMRPGWPGAHGLRTVEAVECKTTLEVHSNNI
jgi:hypothetical protein